MPPSPALRPSPGREISRMEIHKRGRSLEGGLLIKEKEDDLALFKEMQTREKDDFLLDSSDDFEVSLSTRLRYFSDYKLGITIPTRGESSDLLNVDGDKNDYDWLLTPPETPLFASLEDETPSINPPHRGRPRSQPISISRSTTAEKSHRSSRGSASPHRLSPSPQSSISTLQSRGRPLSAHHTSSTPILRPTTPSRSPSRSTTPNKSLTPAPRSSTPTPRRMSTGSSVTVTSSGRTGSSPVKASRGNSSSPKLGAWQSNIPGFSTDAPPNLRTSLADRPASYVRGSSPASRNGRGVSPASSNGRGLSPVSTSARGLSPASRNGRESSSKRQSMSPTASRSASSSCSHDRDQFSSRSKGSVASSGDDDVDSLQSFSMSIADRSAARKVGVFSSSKVQSLSKKPSRVLSSSAPKRSFDSALRQMDRRSPQKMFRPLLSSVPSTTFHAGKASSSHRSVISRNSSVTTSSNASSDQWSSLPPDNEGGEDHRVSEWGKTPYPDVQDDVYVFDVGDEFHDGKPNISDEHFGSDKSEVKLGECDNVSQEIASESACILDEMSDADIQQNTVTCSKCGKEFVSVTLPLEEGDDICTVCAEGSVYLPVLIPEASLVTQISTIPLDVTKDVQSSEELDSEKLLHELQESTSMSEPMIVQEEITSDGIPGKSMEERDKISMDQQAMSQSTQSTAGSADQQAMSQSTQSTAGSADQQPPHSSAHPSLKIDASQGVGMSILLKRSSSGKGSVVQGRTFTATNAPFDDFSYGRESMNSLRSSIGHGSVSTSSSVDLTSLRQTDPRIQRQSSHRKGDSDYSRHGMNIKPLSRGSSFSGTSNHTHHAMVFDMSTSEENFDVSTEKMEFEALEETLRISDEQLNDVQLMDVFEVQKLETSGMMDSHNSSVQLMDSSDATYPGEDTRISSGNAEDSTNNASSPDIEEVSNLNQGDSLEVVACGTDVVEEPTHDSCIMMSEIGTEDDCHRTLQDESTLNPNTTEDELQELLVPTNSEKDEPDPNPASESCTDLDHDILAESTVTVEGSLGQKSRSLTLEEATDTILFCSSIIQNLAYTAANIAIEKETENSLTGLEGSRPTVTLLGKSSPDTRTRSSSNNNKRTPNKSRQKRVETTTTTASPKKTNELVEIKTHVSSPPRDTVAPNSKRPLNPESKCNCTVM